MPEPLDLEPIKARLAAASPGEWAADWKHGDPGVFIPGDDGPVGGGWFLETAPRYDVVFIAHAPTDVAVLIAEVERLRNERGFWRESTEFLSGRRAQD